jgi:predicted alpha/beta superfamily hydrolase
MVLAKIRVAKPNRTHLLWLVTNLPRFLIETGAAFYSQNWDACKDVVMSELAVGNSAYKTTLSSFQMGTHRIDVATPAKVSANTPILVMHDGGNLLVPREQTWNGQNWGIIESLEAGLIASELQPVVVGVYTGEGTSRYNELAPQTIVEGVDEAFSLIPAGVTLDSRIPLGNQYQDFLADEVLPEIAGRLGITLDPSRTAIGGASMGGLASIFGLGRRPEVFGAALSFSTHWPFGWQQAVELLVDALPAAGSNRLWFDAGNIELDAAYAPFHFAAIDRLVEHGWRRDHDFEARIYAGTGHQEKYWAARWPDAVNWWLTPSLRN